MRNGQKWHLITFIIIVFTASIGTAGSFDEIIVFGNSLSDNGNLVLIEEQPLPDPEIYYKGRFSNGPVWVEYLADPQRLYAPLTDRAFGGAQTDSTVPPGVILQVETFVATSDPSPSSDSLFVIWIGGNDYLNGDGNSQEAVDNIEEAMQQLAQFGVKQLLILNLPDLGAIPEILGTAEADQATAFTTNFNAELDDMVDRFRSDHPDIQIYTFDVYEFSMKVKQDPAAFGFSNATEPSPNFYVPNNFDGAGYVFWDDKHPTTSMHSLIADQVVTALNEQSPTPEETDGDDEEDSDDDFGCFIQVLTN